MEAAVTKALMEFLQRKNSKIQKWQEAIFVSSVPDNVK
jgi:hypothetical protein